jgi:transcriptional regulator with XRE-family HTH domain
MHSPKALREARLSGGFKLREVSGRISLDPSTIAAYEVGRANPSPGAASRWHGALADLLAERQSKIEQALVGLQPINGGQQAA